MANFTQGNWQWNVDTAMISNNKGKPIATVYGASVYNNVTDKAETYSNARLIENSPELFNLLSIVYNDIRNGLVSGVHTDILSAISDVLKKINIVSNELDDIEDMSMRPCPFCGNTDPYINEYEGQFFAECPECQCNTRLFDTEKDAVNAWNERAEYENRLSAVLLRQRS